MTLSGSDDGEVRIWEMAAWTCLHTIAGRGSGINAIVSLGSSAPTAERPAAVRVACAADDGCIYSYEYQRGAGWCARRTQARRMRLRSACRAAPEQSRAL